MEYEISDEDRLFDDSTNPSLKHEHVQAVRNQSGARQQDDPADKRKMQKAVVIPEEEDQLA